MRRSLLAAPFTALRDLDRWRNPELLAPATVSVTGIGRFTLRARSDDLFHAFPGREPEILSHIRELANGAGFVDAGANIGFYSVAAASAVGPCGRVYAIEMLPETASILRRHVALNSASNVTVVESALSELSGETVEAVVCPGYWGQASIALPRQGPVRTIHVKTTTLDEILAREPFVDLIKLDLEGAEAPALIGATETLRKTHKVLFETLDQDSGAQAILRAAGFEITLLSPTDSLAVSVVLRSRAA